MRCRFITVRGLRFSTVWSASHLCERQRCEFFWESRRRQPVDTGSLTSSTTVCGCHAESSRLAPEWESTLIGYGGGWVRRKTPVEFSEVHLVERSNNTITNVTFGRKVHFIRMIWGGFVFILFLSLISDIGWLLNSKHKKVSVLREKKIISFLRFTKHYMVKLL